MIRFVDDYRRQQLQRLRRELDALAERVAEHRKELARLRRRAHVKLLLRVVVVIGLLYGIAAIMLWWAA